MADDLAADIDAVFLQPDHFAETFAHTNPAVEADPENVVGVLEEDPPAMPQNGREGDRTVITGILRIPSDVVVSVADQKQSRFTGGGVTWYAVSVSGEGDMQAVRVKRGALHAGRQGVWSGTQPK